MSKISHALVVPEDDFSAWLEAVRPYTQHFERVALVRSPRGNDLNRFRTVSAINAPRVWIRDDPVFHIRRVYPMVVRVDVVHAATPQLAADMLAERVARDDRYGERMSAPQHLYDRFILEYPTSYRPLHIVGRYQDDPGLVGSDNPGLDFLTAPGAGVLAAAPGRVTRIWQGDAPDADLGLARYIQVTTDHSDGETYIITYVGLGSIAVSEGATVAVGDTLGTAAGDSLRLIVQNPPNAATSFTIPDVVDPTPMVYVQDLRLRPTNNGLRVRALPVDGTILGQVGTSDALEIGEMHGRALAKIGQAGQWARIRLPTGEMGFAATWFLRADVPGSVRNPYAHINITGVNLDELHPLGTPPAHRLGDIGWVRFGYNVSNNTGSQDINAAYERYARHVDAYQEAGYHVVFTTSHQTYGEGRNEFWPWPEMNDAKWDALSDRLADMMARIAQQWRGRDIVWQVWNEQDAPIGAVASVPMRSHNYALMLTKVIQAMRAVDSGVTVITGGFTGGPVRGATYAREAIDAMPDSVRPDGVAFHPYGRSHRKGGRYNVFGHISESLNAYTAVLPNKPVWITEWGLLDRAKEQPADVAEYALGMLDYVQTHYPDQVAAMIWYAWAETMHNGYGIVDAQTNPRPGLTDAFLSYTR